MGGPGRSAARRARGSPPLSDTGWRPARDRAGPRAGGRAARVGRGVGPLGVGHAVGGGHCVGNEIRYNFRIQRAAKFGRTPARAHGGCAEPGHGPGLPGVRRRAGCRRRPAPTSFPSAPHPASATPSHTRFRAYAVRDRRSSRRIRPASRPRCWRSPWPRGALPPSLAALDQAAGGAHRPGARGGRLQRQEGRDRGALSPGPRRARAAGGTGQAGGDRRAAGIRRAAVRRGQAGPERSAFPARRSISPPKPAARCAAPKPARRSPKGWRRAPGSTTR